MVGVTATVGVSGFPLNMGLGGSWTRKSVLRKPFGWCSLECSVGELVWLGRGGGCRGEICVSSSANGSLKTSPGGLGFSTEGLVATSGAGAVGSVLCITTSPSKPFKGVVIVVGEGVPSFSFRASSIFVALRAT